MYLYNFKVSSVLSTIIVDWLTNISNNNKLKKNINSEIKKSISSTQNIKNKNSSSRELSWNKKSGKLFI